MPNVMIYDLTLKAATGSDEVEIQETANGTSYKTTVSSIVSTISPSSIITALGYTPVNKAGDTMTGNLGGLPGNAGAPGWYIVGDSNTGIFSPSADMIAMSAGGVERLRCDSGTVYFGVSGAAVQNRARIHGHSTADMAPVAELYRHGTIAGFMACAGSSMSFGLNHAGYTDSQLLAAEKMRLDGAGWAGFTVPINVGVMAAPTSYGGGYRMCQITGSNTTDGGVIRVQTSDASFAADYFVSNVFGGAVLRTTTNHPFSFKVNGTTDVLQLTTGADTKVFQRLFGAALHNNASGMAGATNQYIGSGTYTPTFTNVTNCSAATAIAARYTRVGNVVHVSALFTATITTANTATQVDLTLPIASNLNAAADCIGTGTAGDGSSNLYSTVVAGDFTNDRAQVLFKPATNGSMAITVEFTYEVK